MNNLNEKKINENKAVYIICTLIMIMHYEQGTKNNSILCFWYSKSEKNKKRRKEIKEKQMETGREEEEKTLEQLLYK